MKTPIYFLFVNFIKYEGLFINDKMEISELLD